MSTDNLPDGWTRVKFGDIAASITERVDDPSAAGVDRYVGLEHLDPESTAIRRWGSPSDVEATKLRFYPGDVIYGRRRAYQRKLGVADFDGICSAHALVLRAKPQVCLPEFLPYFLQSDAFHQRALDISVGSLSPTINWKTLAVQEFALPPLDEQHRIAELIAVTDLGSAALARALDAIEDLQEACVSHNLFSTGKERQRVLGDFADVNPKTPRGGAETPFITMDAVPVGGRFPLYLETTNDRGGVRAIAGDVLLARITPCLENGKVCQVPDSDVVIGGSTELLSIRTRGEIDQQLLYFWARSKRTRRLAEGKMSGSTGRLRLSAQDLAQIPLEPVKRSELIKALELLEMLEELKAGMNQQKSQHFDLRRVLLRQITKPADGSS